MVTVTYNAPKGDDRVVEYCGVEFFAGNPVELDAAEHAHLIAKAGKNPHFSVGGASAADEAPDDGKLDAAKAKGAKAKADGKERSVPVAYRGKPQEAAWLAGYDAENAG